MSAWRWAITIAHAVDVYKTSDLSFAFAADTARIDQGDNLATVAWSSDGRQLVAGGTLFRNKGAMEYGGIPSSVGIVAGGVHGVSKPLPWIRSSTSCRAAAASRWVRPIRCLRCSIRTGRRA